MKIAVIIPTLDEQGRIAQRLAELARLRPAPVAVVVVDGGSRDETVARARAGGAHVIDAPRGRAWQMNAGAAIVKDAETLLFLHADVALPGQALAVITEALRDPATVGGAFVTHTIDDRPTPNGRLARLRRRALAPVLRLADLRSRHTEVPYGDQAIFVRRHVFERVGGFPEQPLMEDIELARRLRRQGRVVRLRPAVLVSGRRFLARPVLYTAAVNLFPVLYKAGVSARTLARFYGAVR